MSPRQLPQVRAEEIEAQGALGWLITVRQSGLREFKLSYRAFDSKGIILALLHRGFYLFVCLLSKTFCCLAGLIFMQPQFQPQAPASKYLSKPGLDIMSSRALNSSTMLSADEGCVLRWTSLTSNMQVQPLCISTTSSNGKLIPCTLKTQVRKQPKM